MGGNHGFHLPGATLQFRADGPTHTHWRDFCPWPPTVAQLMAARMGIKLPTEELLPPGERRTLRLRQAAICGGIGAF